ncbi:TPA: sporulation protein Cse60 [Streptococcus suis]
MKIKVFKKLSREHTADFEAEVNDFMATVEVVDVKITMATAGHSDSFSTVSQLLVLYK